MCWKSKCKIGKCKCIELKILFNIMESTQVVNLYDVIKVVLL